jgi:N-acetyltransferase
MWHPINDRKSKPALFTHQLLRCFVVLKRRLRERAGEEAENCRIEIQLRASSGGGHAHGTHTAPELEAEHIERWAPCAIFYSRKKLQLQVQMSVFLPARKKQRTYGRRRSHGGGGNSTARVPSNVTVQAGAVRRVGMEMPMVAAKAEVRERRPKMTQLFLDLGQRDFGSKTCSACGMLFAPGKLADEVAHRRECRRKRHENDAIALSPEAFGTLRAASTAVPRADAVVGAEDDLVVRADLASGATRAHIRRLVDAMARALSWDEERRGEVYVYVDGASRALVGCIAVERINRASRGDGIAEADTRGCAVADASISAASPAAVAAATPACSAAATLAVPLHEPTCMFRYCAGEGASRCSCARRSAAAAASAGASSAALGALAKAQRRTRATLGVRRIWVHPTHRRRGVASRLLGAVSRDFVHGHSVARSAIAFTEPTADGSAFARAFCGSAAVRVYAGFGVI